MSVKRQFDTSLKRATSCEESVTSALQNAYQFSEHQSIRAKQSLHPPQTIDSCMHIKVPSRSLCGIKIQKQYADNLALHGHAVPPI
jgi:hypothetical protein